MTDTNPSPPESVEAIRADIDQTRAELAETVDELSERLNPKVQLDHATASLKQTAAEGAAQAEAVVREAAQHPKESARAGIERLRELAKGREKALAVTAALLLLVRLRRRRQRKARHS